MNNSTLNTIFFVVRVFFFKYTMLPKQAYFEPVLYLGFLKRIATKVYILLPAIAGVLLFRKRLFVQWQNFENGIQLRNVICFLVISLAWRHAFYEYNTFLDQLHLFDRILLIILAALIFWRPVFTIPFLSLVLIIISQFELLNGYSLADSLMPLHLLMMFIAFYLFWLLSNKFSFLNFIFMVGCVIASNYFFSGLGKLSYEWMFIDRISNILPNSYAYGWNTFLSAEMLQTLTKWMAYANLPLKILTLSVELGMLFFFFRLKWTRRLLLATLVFHLGIFFSSGICFWYWAGIHVFLLLYIWKKDTAKIEQLFNLKRMLFAIIVVLSASYWSNPVKLIWFSRPFEYISFISAETAKGDAYRLSPDFFGSYDYNFTFNNFHYMHASEEKNRFGFGGTESAKKILYFFTEERTDQEILQFENQYGSSHVNNRKKDRLNAFLITYIQNFNSGEQPIKRWFNFLEPPDLLWQARGRSALPPGTKIVRLTLHCTTNYYSYQSGPRVVRDEKIHEILIPETEE